MVKLMTNRTKILVIDDERKVNIFTADVTYARTPEEGIKQLTENTWDELHLDHDLGSRNGQELMTGYQLIVHVHLNNIPLPPIVRVVSNNPVGVQRIADCLQTDFGYQPAGFTGRMFVRPK